MFFNYEEFVVLLLIVLPGFVSLGAKNSIVITGQKIQMELICEYVLFGCWNFIVTLPLINLIRAGIVKNETGVLFYVCVFSAFLFLPAVWGLIYGIILRTKTVQKLLFFMGIYRIPSGVEIWDDIFGNNKRKLWVRFWLPDGKSYQGIAEHASSYPFRRELFLSKVKLLDSDGKEELRFDSTRGFKGVLISVDDNKIMAVYE